MRMKSIILVLQMHNKCKTKLRRNKRWKKQIEREFNVIDPGSVHILKMHSTLGNRTNQWTVEVPNIDKYYHHIEIKLNSK
jgi:hypothetical protein